MATVWDRLRATLQEAQIQSTAEAQGQKLYYDQEIGAVDLKSDDLVLVKADASQGKRKNKDRWEDKPHEVVCQIMTDVSSYEVTDQHRQSGILCCNQLLLAHQKLVFPYVWVSAKYGTDVPAPPQLSLLPGEWQWDYAIRRQWSDVHLESGQEDYPGMDQWEAMASPMEVHWSVHWEWMKTSGNV